jgi:hypothetical protein
VSARYGEDTGEDQERKRLTFNNPNPNHTQVLNASFPVQRESELYEFNLGVRQTFCRESRLQPFVGVGTTFMRINNRDTFLAPHQVPQDDGSTPPIPSFPYQPPDERSHDWNLGLYMRTGLVLRLTGDPEKKTLGTFLTTDVRGMFGDEWHYAELNISIGIGR